MASQNEVPSEVEAALSSPKIEPAPPTLEEARDAPGRAEKIAGDREADRERGDRVRLLPADLGQRAHQRQGRGRRAGSRRSQSAATSWSTARPPTCSSTARATTSASGRRSRSWPRSPTSTPSTHLPWDPRVARVYCDCYDTETGGLLEADPRQNLKRIVNEIEQELGKLHVPVRGSSSR